MQTSFLRKTLIANEQNSAIHIPVEWYGADNAQDTKMNALNSFLNFADNHKIIGKGFNFDRESCYDRFSI